MPPWPLFQPTVSYPRPLSQTSIYLLMLSILKLLTSRKKLVLTHSEDLNQFWKPPIAPVPIATQMHLLQQQLSGLFQLLSLFHLLPEPRRFATHLFSKFQLSSQKLPFLSEMLNCFFQIVVLLPVLQSYQYFLIAHLFAELKLKLKQTVFQTWKLIHLNLSLILKLCFPN